MIIFEDTKKVKQTIKIVLIAHKMKPNVGELVFCSGKYCVIIFGFNVTFAFITVLLNACILAALVRIAKRQKWKTSSIIFCAMVIADLLTGLICQPLHGYFIMRNKNVYDEQDLGYKEAWMFFILNYSSYALCCASLLIVTFMSIERLLAIAFALRHRKFSTIPRTVVALVILALFSAVVPLFRYVSEKTKIVFIILLVLVVVLSLCIVLVSYIMLFRSFRQQRITAANLTSAVRDKARGMKQERHLAISFAVITVVLVAMYLPQILLKPISIIVDVKENSKMAELMVLLEDCFNTFLYCNSAVNSFVYFARHGEIQQEIVSFICCRCSARTDRSKNAAQASKMPSTKQTLTRL